jgi:hypothetical protein
VQATVSVSTPASRVTPASVPEVAAVLERAIASLESAGPEPVSVARRPPADLMLRRRVGASAPTGILVRRSSHDIYGQVVVHLTPRALVAVSRPTATARAYTDLGAGISLPAAVAISPLA